MIHNTLLLLIFVIISTQSTQALDNGYGYQTGQISMNDSEITILINSTFEIIEDFDNDTNIYPKTNGKEEIDKQLENGETKTKTIRMKKLKPSSLAQCQKFSEAEKYQLLERAGGRNQLFMADSVDEASQNFADSFPVDIHTNPLGDSPVNTFAVSSAKTDDDSSCDSRCQMIKQALNQEIDRRSSNDTINTQKRSFSRIRASVFSDAPPNGAPCTLGNFIPVGVCTDLGEPVDNGQFESLCSECRGLYMLSSNCFPKIFNSVHCNSQEMGCIFDTITDMAHGQCGMQSLSFKVLRNAGDDNCEDWVVEQVQLPVACQCSLSKNSFLRAKPNKEL